MTITYLFDNLTSFIKELTSIYHHYSFTSTDSIIKQEFKMVIFASKIVVPPTLVVTCISHSMNLFSTATKPLTDINDIYKKIVR